MADGLNVILLLGGYMGGDRDDEIQVRYRFDSAPPSGTEYWSLFQSKESAYLPMRRVPAFTAQARTARQVLIRVTDPLDGEARTNTFDLGGLEAALRQLPCAGRS